MTNVNIPQCLFEPSTPSELGRGIQSLVHSNTTFAVRGGGHMPVPFSSSIASGILVSCGSFTKLEVSKTKKTVIVGAGKRWSDVYTYLAQYDLVTLGGRFGHVGVPGLLLGGGINYFGNTKGWAMNHVVRFQVVLANGTVVNATSASSPDLFWALKGGSSNFGIVTEFELETFPSGEIFGGLAIYDSSQLDAIVNASVAYLDNTHGGVTDLLSAIDPSIGFNPATNTTSIFSVYFHNSSQNNPASLSNFTSIPAIASTVGVRPNFATFVNDTLNPLINTNEYR
jgi:FAD/FMN-containing dehydrogenase